MIRLRYISVAFVLLLVVACQPAIQTTISEETENPEAVQPTPRLLTGVHLQAVYQTPDLLEGTAPSHNEMQYLLFLPDGYWEDADASWPLILFLHGAGGEENDSAFVMSYGLPAVLYLGEQPEEFPFIVVSPQAFPNTPWWVGDTLAILNGLLDEIIQTYRVDPKRVYLTGLSMGGYGSWFMASTYPEKFAAMVSVSGSGFRTEYLPDEETLCTLETVPVWGIHGELDQISMFEANKMVVAALDAACDGEVKWTQYEDLGHGGAYDRAYRDPALFAWMLEHSR